MGYCISDGDFNEPLPEGECEGEMRRESFVLVSEDFGHGYERMELRYTEIPRLKLLIEFIEQRAIARGKLSEED